MNRIEARKFYPILQAFAEGRVIECRTKPSALGKGWRDMNGWTEMKDIVYWDNVEYRIKPEPKYRPFKDAEECWCEMLKHEPFGWVIRNDYHVNIANLIRQSITFADNEGRNSSFSELLEDCTFADGKKFGIKDD